MLSLPPKKKILLKLAKNSFKKQNELFPVVCYFTWKLEFASNILSMVVTLIHLTSRKYDNNLLFLRLL